MAITKFKIMAKLNFHFLLTWLVCAIILLFRYNNNITQSELWAEDGFYLYPEKPLPENIKIDSLVVYKSKKRMLAISNGKCIKIYEISIGRNPIGKKEYEGDNKTPEGKYIINDNDSPC